MTLVGLFGSSNPDDLKFILVPTIAVVVIAYGVVGGLSAAYWTDLIQGLCIIFLSLILIPYGLFGLVERFGDPETMTVMDGFRIMHERVTPENFQLFGGPRSGEFPLHYIVSLSILGLVGIVVQPHFIATGGGSAKSENAARIGLVTGNFMKRFCTIGWALTALIVLALLSDSIEITKDPDEAWGVASREILSQVQIGGFYPGLVGLMLACLLAALMSSADCYMLVTSGLLVRNVYAAYINPNATEEAYIKAGRIAGLLIIIGAASYSLVAYDAFGQYRVALEFAVLFAAPFWVGMFWRRATRTAAWLTIVFSLLAFIVIPYAIPKLRPDLREAPRFAVATNIVTKTTSREATAADVAQREAKIAVWSETHEQLTPVLQQARQAYHDLRSKTDPANIGMESNNAPNSHQLDEISQAIGQLAEAQRSMEQLGPEPAPIQQAGTFVDIYRSGGDPIFWQSITSVGEPSIETVSETASEDGTSTTKIERHAEGTLQGQGSFKLDNLLYDALGLDLVNANRQWLKTLELPTRLVLPVVVMILLSLVTKPGSSQALDRYYVKMKTPVDPDPQEDEKQLQESYDNPQRFDSKKLFPNSSFEMQKPTRADTVGFLVSVGVCFLFLAIAYFLANIGAS